MNGTQNPPASSPTEEGRVQEAATTRPSRPGDGSEPQTIQDASNTSEIQNPGQFVHQQQQYSTRTSARVTNSHAQPGEIRGTLTSPTEATTTTVRASGDRTSWSAQPVGNFNSRVGSLSRGVSNISPPPSSVQPVGHHHHHGMLPEPEVRTLSMFPIQENYSGIHLNGTPAVRLPLPALAINVGPLFQPVYCYPRAMQPEVLTYHGLQYPLGYHHHQGMQSRAPDIRPSESSGEVIPPRRTASVSELIGRETENPSTGHMGQPLRASRQTVAVCESAPDPGPISVPSPSNIPTAK